MAQKGGKRRSRFARPVMPMLQKAVIRSLKPRNPIPRLFQRCRWWVDGQRNILVHERLPLLRAEDHRMDVAAWLRGLGLEQYAQLFRDNDIDGEILCGMTAEDLKELGIGSFSHRRRLLNAIAVLGTEPPIVAQSAASPTSA